MTRKRYKFYLKETFPPDDPVAIMLIRFMAAFNDLYTILECYMRHIKDLKNGIGQDINVAKRCYFFRVTCGHLHEVLCIFESIKNNNNIIRLINNKKSVGKKAYCKLLKIPHTFYSQLCQIRNNMSFHYGKTNEKMIKNSINGFKDSENSCVIVDKLNRKNRFIVADDIINGMLNYLKPRICMRKMIQQIEDVQVDLFDFINFLAVVYIQERNLSGQIRAN